jgi:hypothetical protein
MRRVIASILLALISFPLIGLATILQRPFAPACCRRDGQHRCEMASMHSTSEGPAVIPAKCASWPSQAIALLDAHTLLAVTGTDAFAPPLSQTRIFRLHVATVSPLAEQSAPKRGPPPCSLL